MHTKMKYFMEHPAVAPIEPTRKALTRLRFLTAITGPFVRFLLRRTVRGVEVTGREHLSGPGPKLVLMNHSNALDPVLLTYFGRKPIQFFVTEPYMATGWVARLASWLGQIPKRKLDHDTRSIRVMKKWCEQGAIVGLFPEGQFSWDGEPLALQPGLGQLIRFLDVPVVTARLINGDRLRPAWARFTRRTSLRLEFDPPRRFGPEEEIESCVRDWIHVDPATCERAPVQGNRLAEGLASFLRFCFECGADESMRDTGNRLSCRHCGRSWTATADLRLLAYVKNGTTKTIRSLPIRGAWARVRAMLAERWGTRPALQSLRPVTVYDASRAQWTPVTTGPLTLANGKLTIVGWNLDLRDVLAHTMDWGDLILLRTPRARIALRMPGDSRAVWTFAIEQAIAAAKQPLKENLHAL
jgi:1-acyl-sn-glycerol-3-phosphate acyltransferase